MPDTAAPQEGPSDWPTRLHAAAANRTPAVKAKTYIRKWASASRPVALSCEDGQVYVVKGRHAGRQAINDHIVSQLGAMLGSPTGRPALVEVGQALIDAEPQMQNLDGVGAFVAG